MAWFCLDSLDGAISAVLQGGFRHARRAWFEDPVMTVGNFSDSDLWVFDITNPIPTGEDRSHYRGFIRESIPGQSFEAESPEHQYRRTFAERSTGNLRNLPGSLLRSQSGKAGCRVHHHRSAAFKDAADAYAEYRMNRGLSTKVVCLEDIFNEFVARIPTPESVRAFLKHAYANLADSPPVCTPGRKGKRTITGMLLEYGITASMQDGKHIARAVRVRWMVRRYGGGRFDSGHCNRRVPVTTPEQLEQYLGKVGGVRKSERGLDSQDHASGGRSG